MSIRSSMRNIMSWYIINKMSGPPGGPIKIQTSTANING